MSNAYSPELDVDHLKSWIGHSESRDDIAIATPLQALAATLDFDDPIKAGDMAVPPLWHWLYFLPLARQSEIGTDGHAKRGGFLPPIPLPRRMWAGGRLKFLRPLAAGRNVTRTSHIDDVNIKTGRSGTLAFVKVRHEISDAAGIAIVEEQDIVYRDNPTPGAPLPAKQPAPTNAQWTREIVPDPVLLFRYSALTFNGHRIHYDRSYVTEEEGYPGLVVHGPLIATLLLDLLRKQVPDARVTAFSFRAVSPLFDIAPFAVCGRMDGDKTIKLWARTIDGHLAMDANATLA